MCTFGLPLSFGLPLEDEGNFALGDALHVIAGLLEFYDTGITWAWDQSGLDDDEFKAAKAWMHAAEELLLVHQGKVL